MSTALSFLKNIEKVAHEVALQTSADMAVREGFRDYSHRIDPTPGWTLPIAPQGMTLYGYQAAAVETILLHKRAVLGFDPGMGKTPVALAAIAALAQQGQRTLVVVPPSLRVDPWQREAARQYPNLRVAVVTGQKAAALPDVDMVVMGDSVLTHRAEDIAAWRPDALFIDEAQRHKNHTAKRAVAALAIADAVRRRSGTVVLLSGTLAVNNAAEVYSTARIGGFVKELAGTDRWKDYMSRWCVTEQVWTGQRMVTVPVSAKDPEGLHEALRRSAYVRVERDEVLDMPEKIWVPRSLELNGAMAKYRTMERNFLAWVAEAKGDAAYLKACKAEAITKLMALWQEAGVAKIKAAAEYIESLVQQGEQVVVMAWHQSVVEGLTEVLSAAGILSAKVVGGMSSEAKAKAQDIFRKGQAQVLIGNITAAGTGLNLDVASHLVFVQLPWSGGDLIQASDRIYRVTQRNTCTIHVLNALGTVDEHLYGVLANKLATVDVVNSGQASGALVGADETSVTAEVLASYGL